MRKWIRIKPAITVVMTDPRVCDEIVYGMLKFRTDMERPYDTFKNTIHADRTYMRDDLQLQRRMLVNFIALMMHYRIYGILKKMGPLSRYTPKDVIRHLDRIYMLWICDQWKL